ncbi:MAG: YadA-like family protein [Fusobacterium necrophorum]|nr:YadA-like family protein [Fusobacterium necrophorum]
MIHNLENKVKGCLKRRVSVTLAILTIFAITGSVGYAEELKTDYQKSDFNNYSWLLGDRTNPEKVAQELNKTNKQVKENMKYGEGIAENKKAIEDLDDRKANYKYVDSIRDKFQEDVINLKKEDKILHKEIVDAELRLEGRLLDEMKARNAEDIRLAEKIRDNKIERQKKDAEHDEAIQEIRDVQQAEIAERVKGDLANENAIKDEVKRSTAKDAEHDEKIAANTQLIEDEIERSVEKDAEHDKGIADNKKAIEDEVARSTAEDLKHDKGIADNKKAIEELRRDSEAGIASVAAMSVLDFKGAPVGRVGIGAAVGGYRSKQAVAVGMAYAPNENLNFAGKVGLSTDDIRNSAYGVGVNYFF